MLLININTHFTFCIKHFNIFPYKNGRELYAGLTECFDCYNYKLIDYFFEYKHSVNLRESKIAV